MQASSETLPDIRRPGLADSGRPQFQARRDNRSQPRRQQNVNDTERLVSASAGGILVLQGLARRDLMGLLIASVGGALAYRGATGHCSMYQKMGIDTARSDGRESETHADQNHVRISESFLINKSPEELYNYWHNFENLPKIMTHLESVRNLGEKRSHWVAKAPWIVGGQVEWDAEITAEEPNTRIDWRALPEGDIDHRGSITFKSAPGDRGTLVRVVLEYQPPAGQVGRWIAKMFGEEPEQQIRDDLRRFKRVMEIGEVLTITGQPQGTCVGQGMSFMQWGK
jgi:uncharacterized membrane protein